MADEQRRICYSGKDDSCIETFRSSMGIDPRERHIVCKLDRYDLEDRYLRLLEEVSSLRKLSHSQEDKIKRLATKLMRAGINSHSDVATTERENLALLEAENAKLKDQVCVLRSQLLNHRIFGRSPSRGRRPASTSGVTTFRTESTRMKAASSCHCLSQITKDDNANDLENYNAKMQEMEEEKKNLVGRISELEIELGNYMAGNRREKVAENVEYIRLCRQFKQQNEKLNENESANEILRNQICHYKKQVEELSENNKQVSAALESEKKQVALLSDQVSKSTDIELYLREKDERIRDLLSEVKLLQQHNDDLVNLSTKFSKIESDNLELKRKLSENIAEHQSMKILLSNEKTNSTALEAANEKLLMKLHELQKNIDITTVQLMAQNEKSNKRSARRLRKKSHQSSSYSQDNRNSISNMESHESQVKVMNTPKILEINPKSSDSSPPSPDKKNKKKIIRITPERDEKGIQAGTTGYQLNELISETTQTDHIILTSAKISSEIDENDDAVQDSSITSLNHRNNNHQAPQQQDQLEESESQKIQAHQRNGSIGSNLTREKMLKLLEQAQINSPLDSQSAAILRHIDNSLIPATNARGQRHVSNLESLLYGDANV